jgi:hypothetical protein
MLRPGGCDSGSQCRGLLVQKMHAELNGLGREREWALLCLQSRRLVYSLNTRVATKGTEQGENKGCRCSEYAVPCAAWLPPLHRLFVDLEGKGKGAAERGYHNCHTNISLRLQYCTAVTSAHHHDIRAIIIVF